VWTPGESAYRKRKSYSVSCLLIERPHDYQRRWRTGNPIGGDHWKYRRKARVDIA
jgi:hypothetical protein